MKRPTYEEEQRALSEADPRSPDGRSRIVAALRSGRSLVAARAARLVKEHQLEGLETELSQAFERFMRDPKKTDPACHAKLATIEALDYGESSKPEPFLRAVRHVQLEGASDSAAPLRARALYALARIGHEDFGLLAAERLADAVATVRQASLDALVHRGDRALAPLALLKLRSGDDDPMVILAAMTALVSLAPSHGHAELAERLDGDDEEQRELAAVALGQSRGDEALAILCAALERSATPEAREPLLRGIGLHRSEGALQALLSVIAERGARDAATAIAALSPRRFEPGLVGRVRAAAAQNGGDLDAALAEAFPEREGR